MIAPDSRIYVAGHRGLVGSALLRQLEARGYRNLITRTHAELDLADQAAVRAFLAAEKPEYVLLAAAKVGGIRCVGVASGRSSVAELRDAGAEAVLIDLTDTSRVVAAIRP